jgi:hypothetical protein
MPDPEPIEDDTELAADQRRQTQRRWATAAVVGFLVLVILGLLWLTGVLGLAVWVFPAEVGWDG